MLVFKWLLCAMLLTQMALCPRLWTSDRSFPTVPVLAGLPEIPQALSLSLAALFVIAVLAIAFLAEPRPALFAALSFAILLVVFDINRLQPWFYQAMLLFAALARMDWKEPESVRSKEAWALCGFVFVALYFWSGIQKANLMFATTVFPFLLHAIRLDGLQSLWFIAPVIEAAVGVALVFPRTRTVGLLGVTAMHAFLLVALGPFGQNYNSVVWPWNLLMPPLAFAIFFRTSDSLLVPAWRPAIGKMVILLVGLMPALSFFGWWDDYLSASLYSGTARDAYIFCTEEGAEAVPAQVQPYVLRSSDRVGLDITKWSLADVNVPPYPETRFYVGVARKLEADGVPVKTFKLFVADRSGFTDTKAKYTAVPIH